MATIVMAMLSGWLTLATTASSEGPAPAPSALQPADHDAWVKRIVGLRDHMHTAFGVGPDLTLLDPDEGVAIVTEAWPKIEHADVKTGLLKTFDFSKALPNKHPKLFQVLNLGMTDSDPAVKAYAAAYLNEFSDADFSKDPEGYAVWYKANRDKTPEEVLSAKQPSPTKPDNHVGDSEDLSAQGWQLWQQQKFREAASKFEAAVKLDPQSTSAWNGLGWARFNGGDRQNAITAFEKCVELEPQHPAALNGLGQVYLANGDLELAEKFLKKAAPQAPAAWYGLARIYLLTGKYADAQEWAAKIVKGAPSDSLAQKMLEAAKNKELPDDLRKQIQPVGKGDAGSNLSAEGWEQFNQGKMRLAEQKFRRALAKNPEGGAALNGLGFCLLNNGKVAEAKPYFEKCIELDPDAAGAMNGLARCQKAEGKVDEAIATWERMYKKFPGPNAAAVGLAQTYLERAENAKAVPLFELLVKSAPDNQEFKDGLEAARKGGDSDK